MNINQTLQILDHLHSMIGSYATGTPHALAKKLNISERQLYRTIGELRLMGMPIYYSKKRNSYYYKEETNISLNITTAQKTIFKII